MELFEKYNQVFQDFQKLKSDREFTAQSLVQAQEAMNEILAEQKQLLVSTEALQAVKPLLSKSSIDQCQKLASEAVKAVFSDDYEVFYNSEDSRFYLNHGGYQTDIATAEGGGINSVVAFVFQVYLLIKLHKRRVIFLDEAWSGISDDYLERFLEFVRQMCHDLKFECVLITHDQRITLEQVDYCYEIVEGYSKRIK